MIQFRSVIGFGMLLLFAGLSQPSFSQSLERGLAIRIVDEGPLPSSSQRDAQKYQRVLDSLTHRLVFQGRKNRYLSQSLRKERQKRQEAENFIGNLQYSLKTRHSENHSVKQLTQTIDSQQAYIRELEAKIKQQSQSIRRNSKLINSTEADNVLLLQENAILVQKNQYLRKKAHAQTQNFPLSLAIKCSFPSFSGLSAKNYHLKDRPFFLPCFPKLTELCQH